MTFDDFGPENDPFGEHDFFSVEVEGHKVFVKIEYYDLAMEYGSPDPTSEMQTCRLMTVMLAWEY